MNDKINVPVGDKEDAHLSWANVSTADVCPQCRQIECECKEEVETNENKKYR